MLLLVVTAAPSAGQRPREVWLEAVEGHTPGTWDAAAESISAWSTGQIEAIIRSLPLGRGRPPDMTDTLVRAAMLHADIAMHAPAGHARPLTPYTGAPSQQVLLDDDGRYAGAAMESPDWAIARQLLDALQPAPASYDVVRLWYRATIAWMARHGQVAQAVNHIERASILFPDDPHVHFARGWLNETFAAPTTQAMIASLSEAQPPSTRATSRRVVAGVPPLRIALERAEQAFAAAVAADEDFVEARIHRARVAHLRGRTEAAIDDLRRALAGTRDPFLAYVASLFLGGALEAWGDHTGAADAYRRAVARFPLAQSPHLGLSRLAAATGDRADALKHLRAVVPVTADHPLRGDPWWTYQLGPGRHADVLLSELHAAVPR